MNSINLGILAHVDAGKTTTAERLLYAAGAIDRAGSVDGGDTQTDTLAVERRRGISVRAAEAVFEHAGIRINLIDTPGHTDFTAEVERSLLAIDSALVLVSAAEGVQAQTELFWRAVASARMPAIIFVNKIDRGGCDPEAVLAGLRRTLSPDLVALNGAAGAGSRDCAAPPRELDEDDLLTLCRHDAPLEAAFLEGRPITRADALDALRRQTAAGKVYPVVFGAAALGVGVEALLDALTDFLPALPPRPEAELSGRVYRVSHDPQLGKLAHVRLISGSLKTRDSVSLRREGEPPKAEKVTRIRRLTGGRARDTDRISGGELAALAGLSSAKTGDILGELDLPGLSRLAQPLFSVQVLGQGENPAPLLKAMAELGDEDPLLGFEWEPETREIHIKIMGEVQLEILAHLLAERYGLKVGFSPPTVIYKETPAGPGRGYEAYTMPKPCWAVVELLIEPLERGAGVVFHSTVRDDQILYRYQSHIRQSLPESLRQGLMGWEVTDLRVTLTGGSHHPVHTHPLDFFLATPMAVMNGLEACKTLLLEPLQRLRLTVPEGLAGRLMGDILAMRGEADSPVVRDGRMVAEAVVPVAEALDYGARLAAMTSGQGRMTAEFAGYRECPPELGRTAPRRGVDPRDRSKWILHRRGAL